MTVPRFQFFEFNDQSWLPKVFRDSFNDTIAFTHTAYRPYARSVKDIAEWAKRGKQVNAVLDLGSAGGEHVASVVRVAQRAAVPLPKFILSDLYPAPSYWKFFRDKLGQGSIGFIDYSVDALSVPSGLPRYWTIFEMFHHLSPDTARRFLEEFTQKADGLCIAEFFQRRSLYCLLMVILAFLPNMLVPFFAQRFSFGKLFLTTIIPIVPLMVLFDGIVSVLRTYTKDEIIAMLPEGSRDQFTIEYKEVWYGFVPMKAALVFITRNR